MVLKIIRHPPKSKIMKKIIGLLSLVAFVQMTYAQDFKKVHGILLLKKYESAKDEFEKVIAKKASLETTAEGVYTKAFIYDGLSKDSTLSKKYPTAFDIMNKAVSEYLNMDTSFKTAKELGQDPFFTIYFKAFKDGVAGFSNKEWKNAINLNTNAKTPNLIKLKLPNILKYHFKVSFCCILANFSSQFQNPTIS